MYVYTYIMCIQYTYTHVCIYIHMYIRVNVYIYIIMYMGVHIIRAWYAYVYTSMHVYTYTVDIDVFTFRLAFITDWVTRADVWDWPRLSRRVVVHVESSVHGVLAEGVLGLAVEAYRQKKPPESYLEALET